ncbi:TonB-dependent hemoglobin/transferrin/lactoferrin family receptor [Xylophilus sp. ASV27]|uniref:TonB-dependent hemoglobin/transferrin/lactoferrin family receptor n=1 Tax=Xylophilus sp. ASV27 TaxID=2795129 RepID=UPI0018EB48C5
MARLTLRRPAFRLHPLAWLLASAFAPGAHAQTLPAAPALKEMIISASRSEQDPDELPVSIEVLNAAQMEAQQVRDIRDAVRDMPNVSVQRAPARFTIGAQTGRDQNAGFNIRGLDGNRVLMLVDGIRQPRSYVFQSESAIGRDYLDIGLVKRIEVVKGPTSALYGSDGIAGLVNFVTREPDDYLRNGKTFGGSASAGYDGDDKGRHLGAALAGRANETVAWMLSAQAGRADALKNMGRNNAANTDRTTPNPEKGTSASLLGKVVLTPGGGQKHVLSFEHVEKKADYELLSNIAKPPLAGTSVVGSTANTRMARDRLTWNGRWQLDAPVADEVQAVLSYQNARSDEFLFQDRFTAADRSRNTHYQEHMAQAGLQLGKLLRAGNGLVQKLTYGFDYAQSRVANLQTGVTPPAGESYPLKRFPDTRESSSALYLQDEIIAGPWSITPGLRFDHFSIDARQAGYTAPSPAQSLSGSATSPKLGVLYRATPVWSVYGNYASGFKAPTAGQVNGFFANPLANYESIANPHLRPEKSQNVEIGARGRMERVSLDLAAFTGRFKDFIVDNQMVGGAFTPSNPAIFQSVNLNRVRISGFEVKGNVDWGRLAGGTFSTPFGYGQARGRDRDTGAPVNSINPSRLNLGARYDTPAWAARIDLTHVAAKKAGDIDGATQFATPSATLLDLSGQWRIRKDLRLTAGIYNLTDKKYWNWTNVIGVASTSPVLDAYTQPGRYARVSLVADF